LGHIVSVHETQHFSEIGLQRRLPFLDLVNHESYYIAMGTQFQRDSALHLIVESNAVVLLQSRCDKRLYQIPMIDLIELAWRFSIRRLKGQKPV
jgi:aminoglycoside N3'-acetyltransferase